jgi:Tfp pilus assembly protein PilO
MTEINQSNFSNDDNVNNDKMISMLKENYEKKIKFVEEKYETILSDKDKQIEIYRTELEEVKAKHKMQLDAKVNLINLYRTELKDLQEIVKIFAQKPIEIKLVESFNPDE